MENHVKSLSAAAVCLSLCSAAMADYAVEDLGTGLDPFVRSGVSLNGDWSYVVDPQDMGESGGGKFFVDVRQDGKALIQHDYDAAPRMRVPGDWNTQDEKLFFYEGKVWMCRRFDAVARPGRRSILHFAGVNYRADVWLDGVKVGGHEGGFTPFAFDVTGLMTNAHHSLVVRVDNARSPEAVPCAQFDWWNYGGITRDVTLLDVPDVYVAEGVLQCARGNPEELVGRIRLSEPRAGVEAKVSVAGLGASATAKTDASGVATFRIAAKPALWSPSDPRRYAVTFSAAGDSFSDEIGFRTVAVDGRRVMLNGEPVFFRGASLHDEVPGGGRVNSAAQVRDTIRWAQDLGCNYLRLAHYPHNEATVRELEKAGIMVWSEVPVYWQIAWSNTNTYANAERQLKEMIRRDANRAAVVIWSVANETPFGDDRDRFLTSLVKAARSADQTRLVSLALLHGDLVDGVIRVEDTLASIADVVCFNEYLYWYWSTPEEAATVRFDIPYAKPVFVSEFGGGAIAGRHGPEDERWTEEYQAKLYRVNLSMLSKIEGLAGLSPWVFVDFRSPRRPCPGIQDYYNRKGLVSDKGEKKLAFGVMREFYENVRKNWQKGRK